MPNSKTKLFFFLRQFHRISIMLSFSIFIFYLLKAMNLNKENQQFSQQKRELFDQFVFVDNLTNRSIAIRQIKRCSSKPNKVKCHKPRFSEQQQIKQLDQCIALLRQTNSFKKQNLKNKLFGAYSTKNLSQIKQDEEEQISKKKRFIRCMLNEGINKRNKEELKEYLSGSGHKPDIDLLKVARNKNYPISKNKVREIVGALQKKQSGFEFGKHSFESQEQDMLTRKLDILQSEIQAQLREKLRKTGQFLVQPKRCFLPIKSIRSHNLTVDLNIRNTQSKIIDQLKWRQASLQNSQLSSRPRKIRWISNKNNQNNKANQMFQIVSKGQVEDVEIAVGKYGNEVAKARDKEGNNLLHHAARLNKPSIFEYLLKIRKIQGLLEKNVEDDTPIDVACRLEHMQILKFVPQSLI